MRLPNNYSSLANYCLSILLLIAHIGCHCTNEKGGNTNDQPKKNAIPQLKLQVQDIVGNNNIRFKVINTGAGTADLNKFALKLEVIAATERNNHPIQGVKLFTSISRQPNTQITESIAKLIAHKQILAPSESIEIEKIFLDAPDGLEAATISCKIINPEREEVDQKTIPWKTNVPQVAITMIPFPNPVYINGKVKFQFSCKNITQVPLTTDQLMGTFIFHESTTHSIRFIHQEAISITHPVQPNDVILFSIEIQDPKAQELVNFINQTPGSLLKIDLQTKEGVWLGRQQETIHIKIKEKGKLEIKTDPQKITLTDNEITIPVTLKNAGNTSIDLQILTYEFSILDGTNLVYQTSLSGSSTTWNANPIHQGEEQAFTIKIDKATRDLLVKKKDIANYPIRLIIKDAETDIIGELQQPLGLKIGPIPVESRVDIEVLLSETNKFPIYKKLKGNGKIKYKVQVNPKGLRLTIKNISNHPLKLGDLYFDFRFVRSKDGIGPFEGGKYCEETYQISFNNLQKDTVLTYQGNTSDLTNTFSLVSREFYIHKVPRNNDEEAKKAFVTGMIQGYPIALQITVFAKETNRATYELGRKKIDLPPQYIDIIPTPPTTPNP